MFFILYVIQASVRDNLPRLKYGRKSLWGLAVGGPTVDGALVTRGGARARYFPAFLTDDR